MRQRGKNVKKRPNFGTRDHSPFTSFLAVSSRSVSSSAFFAEAYCRLTKATDARQRRNTNASERRDCEIVQICNNSSKYRNNYRNTHSTTKYFQNKQICLTATHEFAAQSPPAARRVRLARPTVVARLHLCVATSPVVLPVVIHSCYYHSPTTYTQTRYGKCVTTENETTKVKLSIVRTAETTNNERR